MKQTIKTSIATAISAASTLALATPVFAQEVNPCPDGGAWSTLCTISSTNVGSVLSNVVTAILVIAAVIALFFLIWGGVKWILSGGDKGKVEAARATIIAAIIGLIVTFLAFFILSIVLSFFGLSLANLTLPTITGSGTP